MEDIKKFQDIEKAEKNPFVGDGYQILVRERCITQKMGKGNIYGESDIGEAYGSHRVMWQKKKIDAESFVKLYTANMEWLYGLSKTSLKIFEYIVSHLERDSGEVYIYMNDLLEYTGWAQSNIAYRGFVQLVNKKMIWPSVKPGWWFVNPNIIFKGDRLTFIYDYVKETEGLKISKKQWFEEIKMNMDPIKNKVNEIDEIDQLFEEFPEPLPEGYVRPSEHIDIP